MTSNDQLRRLDARRLAELLDGFDEGDPRAKALFAGLSKRRQAEVYEEWFALQAKKLRPLIREQNHDLRVRRR